MFKNQGWELLGVAPTNTQHPIGMCEYWNCGGWLDWTTAAIGSHEVLGCSRTDLAVVSSVHLLVHVTDKA